MFSFFRCQGVPVSFEVCDSSQEMVLPMKQCANWLQTYFCEPWFIEKVPTPSFHHPVLEKVPMVRERSPQPVGGFQAGGVGGVGVGGSKTVAQEVPGSSGGPHVATDSFTKTVLYSLMKNVKMGDTVSYKRLAEIAGNDKAARAVGGAMRSNPVPLIIPCHRVICSDGKTGNYSSGKANHLKEWLLAHEKLLKEM
uniref:Methylated-DNA--protein-cysteine methyltransferase n=1 Tax=Leptobrachium leishanense TaxID=445787 RepID=A0A8C5QJW9_9ANUR